MKLHYSKILLFVIPLIILVNTNKKPPITPHHTPIYTSRQLSEKDIQSSNYYKDTGMKSVMQQFVDRTSQRLRKYDERMKDKRQKRKEERDKNIEKIIEKDKMEKSLVEKVEKGCLRCGCALGGGVLPVWVLANGLWYATWSQYFTKTATQKGIEAGVKSGFEGLRDFHGLDKLISISEIENLIKPTNYDNGMIYVSFVQDAYETKCAAGLNPNATFCDAAKHQGIAKLTERAAEFADNAANMAKITEECVLAEGTSATSSLTTAITASIITIVVIVLIMVIIYLILRFERKKKMKKKLQYKKLLKE
ncbi:rifin PIR protein, putative [Plasmodium reichenowi]|uniref:Rifin PIR protein, putative n=1 Tax=Plasmodium reichenowi TaxID=5854 RepID=A0A2P9DSU3_PLARE|nr:rifin PIR protein, putative [Plasmodium reichenowi]